MKTSSLGYWVFFGTLVVAVATKTPALFMVGFVVGTILVLVGEVREGNKNLIIKAVFMAIATGLMVFLKK